MTDPRKKERIRVLVADDQPHILEAVELLLQPQGIQADCVRSPQLLLEALGQCDYDVLLIDLNYTRDTTSGQEGLDLLARLQEIDPRLPVIVMTAWGNIDLAVESIKRGARDFIQKPWENERLVSLIRVHAELHQALAPGAQPGTGKSPAPRRRHAGIHRRSPFDAAGSRTHCAGGPV